MGNGSAACIMPYLSVFFDDIGMDAESIGFLQSLRTSLTIIAAPIWGALAAKFRAVTFVLMVTFTCSVAFRMCLLLAKPKNESEESHPPLSILIGITILWASFYAPVQTLLDTSVIHLLPSDEKSSFGRFRLWGKLGNFITSSLMGVYIYKKGYQFAFWGHAIISVPTLVCFAIFHHRHHGRNKKIENTTMNKMEENNAATFVDNNNVRLLDGIKILINDVRLIFAMIQILVVGFSFGLVGTFCYVLVGERAQIDGRESGIDLMLCRIVLSIGGITMYYISKNIIHRFGHFSILISSLFSLAAVFLLYSFIESATNPIMMWTSMLLAELLRGGTFAIFWSTVLIFIDDLSPSGTNAMMLTIMESIYRGFGHTLGALLGGILVENLGGIAITFRYVGYFTFGLASLSKCFAYKLRLNND